jgi:glycosyltransferase involved in cell wall biosynthesis
MSMVNLEGAACGVPSITTHETGLWDWEKGGGLLIHPTIDELAMALRSAASWSVEERNERGCRSHQLLTSRYSWDEVIPQWKQLYEELIGK